ncbi:MAG: DEAD/DEAH box helicase, partial [Cryomorphaceae bacterium]|nr:DEAD/DEAH box helicase [Cryomorphaceae bacterium]
GTEPNLSKLGSPAWQNAKSKTKRRVKEVAFDLIKLYAKRREARGFAFSPDSYLQHELEASFAFEDTPDQIKATADVKNDMESPIPMDRLICGDVGFGKTEIAVRAAFKAVADSKQVAILVPTTLLAFQHFRTFSKRLQDLPARVDYINRSRSAKEVKAILQDLEEGRIDILIGTHRILSKDLKFKDLGLMIIDEEQKFGVNAKDKLKAFKANIDTLTLSATPIPRTLQFSLMSARDLSVMTTPPPNRQPVDTYLIGFNEERLRDSISYEISRGGQVFVISNRIQNLSEVAGMLQRLVPDARIATGHGQMNGHEMEELIIGFMEARFDVLVSTTIVENGLDVPNANTIIILDAHMFGLSDLHQMRGRVGRSNRKAFCYLISPPLGGLPEEARKRLQALEQFSDLGSGFKIALRDLEIRGAGDLLGAEQSGFINDLGFETYQKLLAEAVEELKQSDFKELYQEQRGGWTQTRESQLDTDWELLLPDTYVNSVEERLRIYRELDALPGPESLETYRLGLVDRFGTLPPTAENMLQSLHIRWLGQSMGMDKIRIKSNKLMAYFPDDGDFSIPEHVLGQFLEDLQRNSKRFQMKQKDGRSYLVVDGVNTVSEAIELLQHWDHKKAKESIA